MLLGLAGWVIVALALAQIKADPAVVPLLVGGVLVLVTGILTLVFGLRCPKCGGNLGHVLAWPPCPFRISARIQRCSFCGTDFDSVA